MTKSINYTVVGCRSVSFVISLALFWSRAAPQSAVAFAPVHHSDGNRLFSRHGCLSNCGLPGLKRMNLNLHASVPSTNQAVADLDLNSEDANQMQQTKKENSYAAVLKVIDESHYNENKLCSYLATETVTSAQDIGGRIIQDDVQMKSYHSPDTPVMSDEAVNALRIAAHNYFEGKRESEIDRVDLGELLSSEDGPDLGWKKDLDAALTEKIYPLVRSGWPNHDAFTLSSSSKTEGEIASSQKTASPVLTVTSASVFAGGGFPGAKVTMTTLERDAGLFVVHIDLGNDTADRSVMGALFLESLAGADANMSIVGPISPGQVVVHRSMERTAALMVSSNIHTVEQKSQHSLDSLSRRHILRAAESTRHYALRLVLTTKSDVGTENTDGSLTDIPEAPSEERSYRLRHFARFNEDRVRYLTLAGLLDVDDYENQFWLGFDYIARMDNPEYQADVRQRLSDINKAVFHLDRAAALCPTDSRVHFQLATAIGVKSSLLMDATNGEDDSAELDLARAAEALERSAQYETTAVKLAVNDIQDLTIALHALAETRCKIGEFDKALSAIDRWAECGSIRSALAIEDTSNELHNVPSYEWIRTPEMPVAVKTVGDVPLFDRDDLALLRAAADRRFALAAGIQTSRYTMQYEGNSEVHLDDLCAGDPILKARMDKILQGRVYPLVRAAFSEESEVSGGDVPPLGSLCVYDSIFVRYNGDTAKAAGLIGAAQPLHQDGGIYSVNIALNAHKDVDENGFTGGGTFMEALTTVDQFDNIQLPIAPGHAIVHKTTQRHAGAPTTSGVRDILVIFLTARRPESTESDENTWRIERAMRLQSIAKMHRDKLIPALQLARSNDPANSEVPYWLGVHLIQGDIYDPKDVRWEEICQGVDSLKLSTVLNPADARAHYHHGMGISTRHKYAMRTKRAHLLPPAKEAAEDLINALESAIRLEGECEKAGCSNGLNLAAAYLALGDFMARLKSFDRAITYLNQVEGSIRSGDIDKNWSQSILQEVSGMLEYCQKESAKKSEASIV
ncbi:hypothetical protein ACHAXR_012933 [Thalassiosira sp. AJA248-18]